MGKIAVIGDIVLDVYHFGENRENPESSAPCYTIEKTDYRPGCAGNVISNLKKLGSDCILISVIGEDEDGKRLAEILESSGVNSVLIKDNKRSTAVKERYLSINDGRYHFRADFEKKRYIGEEHVEEIMSKVNGCSMVIISDYNKGVISKELMERLKKTNCKIIADVKPNHKEFFKGIFMIKPNIKEVREMAGMDDEVLAAGKLVKELQTNVLLTRGKDGSCYFGLNGERYYFKSEVPSEKVLDVTGAGDVVVATFCHLLNKGYPIGECVRLANKAGGISAQYPGCYQVSEEELGIK